LEKKYINIHQDIIDECIKGDSKAQFQLYKLYYKPMYNTCLRIVNDKIEAEDVMQEAFFACFKKLHSYDGEVSFGAWLKKIVINKSLDFIKKKKIEFEPIDNTIYKIVNQEDISEDDEEIIKNELNKIKNAIQKLADGYRIVISLYLLEGYDHEEIAEILNISSSSSRSQLVRAKKKLLELLKI
jgi:RNA polymerase sigma factor (sigma-70 family)